MFRNFKVDNARRVNFSGESVQIPKSKWAYLRNLMVYGNTTGGEGTPDNPIPLIGTPSGFNTTICGENHFNINDTYVTRPDTNIVEIDDTQISVTGRWFIYYTIKVAPNTDYYFQYTKVSGVGYIAVFDIAVKNGIKTGTGTFNSCANSELCILLYAAAGPSEPTTSVFKDISVTLGTTAPAKYIPFVASTTYPYRLEDTNGVLHEMNSLPDGTADSYDRDNNLLTAKMAIAIITGAETIANYTNASIMANYIGFAIDKKLTNVKYYTTGANNYGLCNIGLVKSIGITVTNTSDFMHITPHSNGSVYVVLPRVMLTHLGYTVDIAGFTKMLQDLNNAATPFELLYELATPITYPIKPYSTEFMYNAKPVQVESDIANVFTDASAQPTLNFDAVSY